MITIQRRQNYRLITVSEKYYKAITAAVRSIRRIVPFQAQLNMKMAPASLESGDIGSGYIRKARFKLTGVKEMC